MFKNWKTSVIGILAVAVQLGHFIPAAAPYVGPVTAILTGLGLYHAQDAAPPAP